MEVIAKIRYKDKGNPARIYKGDNQIHVRFVGPAKSIAPGQSAVFYEGDGIIAGGIIQR